VCPARDKASATPQQVGREHERDHEIKRVRVPGRSVRGGASAVTRRDFNPQETFETRPSFLVERTRCKSLGFPSPPEAHSFKSLVRVAVR